MKDRIKEFIEYKGISAGELAISLDVQRSNISHILNGRNKPGAALIEKLLLVFPDLNARWLLTGDGNMVNTVATASENRDVKATLSKQADNIISASGNKTIANKPIDKVILLYTDGTFSSFSNK
jgi:transcriptional regulator with XRE-family HTH domain